MLESASGRECADVVVRLDAAGSLQWGLLVGPPAGTAGRARVHCVGLSRDATLLEYVPGEWVRQGECPAWFARAARAYLRSLGALSESQLGLLGVARG